MSGADGERAILDALSRVPPDRWGEVLSYLRSLEPAATTGEADPTAAALLGSGLVGLWEDRPDLGETRAFARRLREESPRRDLGR